MEERSTLLSDESDKNTMEDAEMEAELQGLQAGQTRSMPWPMLSSKGSRKWSSSGADAWKRWTEGSEDEQEQGRASQQVALPCQAESIKLHQRAVWSLTSPRVRGVLGEGGGAGRSIQIARTAFL